ncbi:MAG TPA: phosphate ABC transporter permease PstA [Candidatus Omnitrophota bacterium]|nr:phosphate ABC transporter permease PstA [Candidatus Omnitrophota bacterium]
MIQGAQPIQKIIAAQKRNEAIFRVVAIAAVAISLATLGALLFDAFSDGLRRLDWQFLTSFPSRKPERAGILAAIAGSFYVVSLTSAISIPLGIGAAVYLEEYAKNNRFNRMIEVNITNLAGVPSIIYGILGLELFVRMMKLDRSLMAGALTLSLLALPTVIISAREAIRTVPSSIRQAAYAVGATRWQTTRDHVLPLAFPGIMTGIILAISRAIGETAPLIMIGALTYVAFLPTGLDSPFTVMPIQIFNWVSRPQKGFFECAAAGIVVLLILTLMLNGLAIILRNYYQRKFSVRSL